MKKIFKLFNSCIKLHNLYDSSVIELAAITGETKTDVKLFLSKSVLSPTQLKEFYLYNGRFSNRKDEEIINNIGFNRFMILKQKSNKSELLKDVFSFVYKTPFELQ